MSSAASDVYKRQYKFFGFYISYTILNLPCLFSTYHLCYLFSVPFPPLSLSHSLTDNPPCDLHFCDSVPVLVVCLVFLKNLFLFNYSCPIFSPLYPPLPAAFPSLSSCPRVVHISSLASPFPILFLTSPVYFVAPNYAS